MDTLSQVLRLENAEVTLGNTPTFSLAALKAIARKRLLSRCYVRGYCALIDDRRSNICQ